MPANTGDATIDWLVYTNTISIHFVAAIHLIFALTPITTARNTIFSYAPLLTFCPKEHDF